MFIKSRLEVYTLQEIPYIEVKGQLRHKRWEGSVISTPRGDVRKSVQTTNSLSRSICDVPYSHYKTIRIEPLQNFE